MQKKTCMVLALGKLALERVQIWWPTWLSFAAKVESRLAEVERCAKRQVDDNRAQALEAMHHCAEVQEEARCLSQTLAYTRWAFTRPEQGNEPPRDDLLPAPQTQAKQVEPPRSST